MKSWGYAAVEVMTDAKFLNIFIKCWKAHSSADWKSQKVFFFVFFFLKVPLVWAGAKLFFNF